jgi:hypothetical protein
LKIFFIEKLFSQSENTFKKKISSDWLIVCLFVCDFDQKFENSRQA